MCFGNRNVLRTLSKVPNPLLVSQRDWVSADGAAFHTQPECTNPSCYRFPWHLERWHDKGVAGARRHHLHSHSITNVLCILGHFCTCFVSSKLFWEYQPIEMRQGIIFYCEREEEAEIAQSLGRRYRIAKCVCRDSILPGKFQRKKYCICFSKWYPSDRISVVVYQICKHHKAKYSEHITHHIQQCKSNFGENWNEFGSTISQNEWKLLCPYSTYRNSSSTFTGYFQKIPGPC